MFRIPFTSLARASSSLVLFAAGCVLSPLHNDVITSTSAPVAVVAYTQVSGESVQVQCRAHLSSTWTTAATTTASTTPIPTPKGILYAVNTSVVIPSGCWLDYHNGTAHTTELQFLGSSPNLGTGAYAVYDAAGLACLGTEYALPTSNYVSMSSKCRLKTASGSAAEYLYLHAK